MNPQIIRFAIEAHQFTNHLYNGGPYAVHLAMVSGYAMKYIDCIPDSAQQCVIDACWLHDVIEDCRFSYNDVKAVAGEGVANIVYAVTNEKGRNRAERANDKYYESIRVTPWAKYVKLCDRLANVKYSQSSGSKMFHVYAKENAKFINALFLNENEKVHYNRMINELTTMLHHELSNSHV